MKSKAFLIAISLFLVCCGQETDSDLQVTEPKDAKDYEEVLAIYKDRDPICSAVYIGERIVLSAAHCFKEFKVDGESDVRKIQKDLRVGASWGEYKITDIEIQEYKWHNLINLTDGRDLAIFRLDVDPKLKPAKRGRFDITEGFLFSKKMSPEEFDRKKSDQGDFSVAGYGATEDYMSNKRRFFDWLPFRGKWGLNDEDIHAGTFWNDACQGDSGGGLYMHRPVASWRSVEISRELIGITSRGFTMDSQFCGQDGDGTLFTNITRKDVSDWIDRYIERFR